LEVTRSLIILDLKHNKFSGNSIISLVKSILYNVSLRFLDLRWNNIGVYDSIINSTNPIKILAASLSQNQYLLHIDLSYNFLNEKACFIIGEKLEKNKTLIGIHLNGNKG
jgi:hypothetical protein